MPSVRAVVGAVALLAGTPLLTPPQTLHAQGRPVCAPDNAGLTLPPGFCALIVADQVGPARHLTVAPNGDVFVALSRRRQPGGGEGGGGGILVLRDTDGDGAADIQRRFGGGSGDDVEFRGDYLYYSTNDAIMRYPWRAGAMEPSGEADTIVSGLPATRSHRSKSIAFGAGGALFVNIGSPSNVCTESPVNPIHAAS